MGLSPPHTHAHNMCALPVCLRAADTFFTQFSRRRLLAAPITVRTDAYYTTEEVEAGRGELCVAQFHEIDSLALPSDQVSAVRWH